MIVVTRSTREVILRIRQRFRDRVLEWEHAIMTCLWGLIILGNPAQFDSAGFAAFVGGPVTWGWTVTIAGVLRLAALCVNGYMARPTALIRVLAGVSGILLFAAISLGFLFSWRWGTALAMYPVVGFFGLFSVYWAIFDVAIPDDHRHDTSA
jgi:hypothetical protein